MNETIKMQLSAFVDGELPENEAELLLRRMSQDAELRQQVAEYLAIGRAMRGDVQVAGLDQLREHVANAIGEELPDGELPDDVVPGRSYVRPMLGFAVAASVALVAIFGLRQVSVLDDVNPDDGQLAGTDAADTYVTPTANDELTERLLREHLTETDGTYNTLVIVLPIDEEILDEDAETAVDESQDDPPAGE